MDGFGPHLTRCREVDRPRRIAKEPVSLDGRVVGRHWWHVEVKGAVGTLPNVSPDWPRRRVCGSRWLLSRRSKPRHGLEGHVTQRAGAETSVPPSRIFCSSPFYCSPGRLHVWFTQNIERILRGDAQPASFAHGDQATGQSSALAGVARACFAAKTARPFLIETFLNAWLERSGLLRALERGGERPVYHSSLLTRRMACNCGGAGVDVRTVSQIRVARCRRRFSVRYSREEFPGERGCQGRAVSKNRKLCSVCQLSRANCTNARQRVRLRRPAFVIDGLKLICHCDLRFAELRHWLCFGDVASSRQWLFSLAAPPSRHIHSAHSRRRIQSSHRSYCDTTNAGLWLPAWYRSIKAPISQPPISLSNVDEVDLRLDYMATADITL